jgi:hypothetical protein
MKKTELILAPGDNEIVGAASPLKTENVLMQHTHAAHASYRWMQIQRKRIEQTANFWMSQESFVSFVCSNI